MSNSANLMASCLTPVVMVENCAKKVNKYLLNQGYLWAIGSAKIVHYTD